MSTWLANDARRALDQICNLLGLHGEKHLLHFAKTAVFSIPNENLAVKVSRPNADWHAWTRSLRFAIWLQEEGLPGSRVAGEINREPFRVDDLLLSFWRMDNFLPAVSGPEFGQALRSFHLHVERFPERLPELDPLSDISRILSDLEKSTWKEELPLLWEWHSRLLEEWRAVPSLLGEGTLHGNAHRGNAARLGRDVCMLDYDLLAWGPREWDLLPEALLQRRYGRPHRDYELFARTYGFDIFSWPGFQNMILIRELLATVFRMQADDATGGETESHRRLRYWQGERSALWRGF